MIILGIKGRVPSSCAHS